MDDFSYIERLHKERKLILVLDIDETICQSDIKFSTFSKTFDEKFIYVDGFKFSCKLRPGLNEFLSQVSELCEIYIYTNGTREYAKEIITLIDKDGKYINPHFIGTAKGQATDINISKKV